MVFSKKALRYLEGSFSTNSPRRYLVKAFVVALSLAPVTLVIIGMNIKGAYFRLIVVAVAFIIAILTSCVFLVTIKRYFEMRKKADIFSHISDNDIHKIRSSVSVQIEGIKIILDGIAGELKPKQKALLEISKKGAERIAQFLNHLFSRVEKQ